MANMLLLVFGSIFAAAIGHYFVDTQSWQHTKLFGGFLNPPTPGRNEVLPGELSFITWIFHWSMIIDYCYTLPRYMWRWGEADCTGNRKWKLYTLLHSPAFLVNAIVVANHLHRDQLASHVIERHCHRCNSECGSRGEVGEGGATVFLTHGCATMRGPFIRVVPPVLSRYGCGYVHPYGPNTRAADARR